MKSALAQLFAIFFLVTSFAQSSTQRIDSYKFHEDDSANVVIVQMAYNSASVVKITGDTVGLKKAGELIIEIVCTDFPASLNLTQLNQGRLDSFFKCFPLVSRKLIRSVQILRQMDGSEKQNAKSMFHGMVVHFRVVQTKEGMKSELAKLDSLIGSDLEDKKPELKVDISKARLDSVSKASRKHWTFPKTQKWRGGMMLNGNFFTIEQLKALGHDTSCYLILSPKKALKKGFISRKEYVQENLKYASFLFFFYCVESDSNFTDSKETPTANILIDSVSITKQTTEELKQLPDSTILKAFKRNHWKDFAITGDVTGSMYSYTAQLLLWIKLQSLDSLTNNFTFFNDGDDKPDYKKKIGQTGGIYQKSCVSFSEVLNLIKGTMLAGGGGDSPENDVEALLASESQFSEIAFHVLIADNWAPLKDQKLIKKLTKPVRVVLCGVLDYYVTVDYLNLARQTGGSVHLMEQDLYNLARMHEGETLTIGKKSFRIDGGEFKEIKNFDQRL
jgi:hypothetical protein